MTGVTQVADRNRFLEGMRHIGEGDFDLGIVQRRLDCADDLVFAFPTVARGRSRPPAHQEIDRAGIEFLREDVDPLAGEDMVDPFCLLYTSPSPRDS